MEKIFLDTNIIIDFVQKREGEVYVRQILDYANSGEWRRLYVSYLSMANMAFILRKSGLSFVKETERDTMKWCNVLPSGDMQIMSAMKSGSPDFEDALQIACAEEKDCDLIITRNPDHFRDYTEIPVLSPEEFVRHCGKGH